MKVLFLLGLGLAAVLADPLISKRSGERIVGGSDTDISNYPYAAALLYYYPMFYMQRCTGTIIRNNAILTSARCFINSNSGNWITRVGYTHADRGGYYYRLQDIIRHPSYNQETNENDIAIVHTRDAFVYNSNIAAASIAGTSYNLADNSVVWAAGWGAGTYTPIRHVATRTINQDTCRTRYAELGMSLTDNMLCSGWLDVADREQCQGNSGGPLVHYNVLVGIYSWGYQCDLGKYPSVNTRVSSYATWIQDNA